MNKLKISVVVPFFDTPINYFKQCINALKKLNPYEVILIDDCSTNEETINESLNSGFKYQKTPYQSGYDGLPLNIGVKNASGDYICRIDSDDILLELPTFMDTDICFGKQNRVMPATNLTLEELILGPRALCNALVAKKEIFLKHPFAAYSNVYGHKNFAIQTAREIENELMQISSPNCYTLDKKANKKAKNLMSELKIKNIEYDKRTNHGMNDGARF